MILPKDRIQICSSLDQLTELRNRINTLLQMAPPIGEVGYVCWGQFIFSIKNDAQENVDLWVPTVKVAPGYRKVKFSALPSEEEKQIQVQIARRTSTS